MLQSGMMIISSTTAGLVSKGNAVIKGDQLLGNYFKNCSIEA